MKQTVNIISAGMKTINKNTLAVVSTSGTTMTSNSSQFINFSVSHTMSDLYSYKSIKVRFKQEGTSIVDADVYQSSSGYILSSKLGKANVISTSNGYYREVDLTNVLLANNSTTMYFAIVTSSTLKLHTNSSTYKPELVIEYLEDDPSIKNQKFLSGQTCSKDQYNINVRTGELNYGIGLFDISSRFIPFKLDLHYTTRSITNSNIGFPTGWKLNAHQYIYQDSSNFIYIDKNGIKHKFTLNGTFKENVYYDTLHTYLVLRVYPSSTTERYVLEVDRYEKMYFNSSGYLVKITKQVSDSKTYETTFTYSSNKLTSISNDGDVLNIAYGTSTITLTHSASSKVCTLTFDSSNKLTKVKGFDNIETSFTYNGSLLVGVQTLKKKVEFEFITLTNIVKRFKESFIDGSTVNVDKSVILDFQKSQTRVGVHPYSSYTSNTGSLYYIYHFNDEGEVDKVYENKGTDFFFTQIIVKDGDNYYSCTNTTRPYLVDSEPRTFTTDSNIVSVTNEQFNKSAFVVLKYNVTTVASFLDTGSCNPKIRVLAGTTVLNELELDCSRDGVMQIAIPFEHRIDKANITDDDKSLGVNIVFNGGNYSVTISNVEFYVGGSSGNEIYSNVSSTANASVTTQVDETTYYKWGKVNLTFTIDGVTRSVPNVNLTYEDLVKNMDNFIHARNNQQSNYDIFINNGNLLAGVTNVKYGSTTQVNLKALVGKISSYSASYQLLEVSGTDNKITEHTCFKTYKGNDRKKITITDKYRKVKSVSDDSGYSETYTYDANGSVSNVLINNSNTYINGLQEEYKSLIVDYENNNGNVTKEKEYCDSLTIGNSYTYDSLGRVSTVHDFNNSSLSRLTNTYGAYLTKCKFPITSSTSEENNLTYEGELIKTLSQTGGANVEFIYNERNDVKQIKIGGSNYCTIENRYLSAGKVEIITYANNDSYTYTYDIYGKLLTIHKGTTLLKSFSYKDLYDQNNTQARIASIQGDSDIQEFAYGRSTYDVSCDRAFTTSKGIEEYSVNQKSFSSVALSANQAIQVNQKDIKDSNNTTFLSESITQAKVADTLRNQIYKEIMVDNTYSVKESLISERLNRAYIQDVQMGSYIYRRTPSFKVANSNTTNFVEKDKFKITYGGTTTEKNIAYQYNNRGMITSIDDGINNVTYTYDHQNRLTREVNTKLGKIIDYFYDKNGNITLKQLFDKNTGAPLEEIGFSYDANNKLLTYKGTSVTHNAKGEITLFKGNNLAWTDGKLTSYKSSTFKYGVDGQRIYKGTTVGSSNIKINYLNDEESMFKEKRSDGKIITFLRGASGFIGFVYDGKTYYYRKNILGDVIELYYNGNVEAKYAYDAWGNHVVLNPNGTTNTSTSFIGNINPIRYRGYYYDVETQLYWVSSRYYSPELCRWISPDSIEYLDPQSINGLNLYAYCGNDPVM
ncbi:MAG: RHS repeat-associated core domain-containing protein [Erysipelotrichaceae bacterium]|nr:RHS repeat-associated core domain-containing protein [Erysipelotrichaceae bacterium]